MLRHLIDSCTKASIYINNWTAKNIVVDFALCIPYNDPIKKKYGDDFPCVEGPEDDVLARYKILMDKNDSQYIVRVTADCPLMPSFIISKCITVGVMNEYDYLSNVDERCRTSADGMDCEVISKRLLSHAFENAKDPSDREHVTTFMRRKSPDWAKQGTIINFIDLAHIKLSLDTPDDLVRIRAEYAKIQNALHVAQGIFGKNNVHRF